MKLYIILLAVFIWQVTPKEEIINVHIIPHTHDDAGWLFTLEDYYTGNNNMGKCVKCILDNMLVSLSADEKRTFTYVEMAFFEKWYSSQTSETQEKVKQFVRQGRLDFANAGWVMNDEATTHYQDIIDQMRLGMHFLRRELNYTPKVAWYIDPFGHSLTNAYILSQLGFENLVMVRIDFREKEKLIREKSMEFTWRPYFELDDGKSSLLTHVTHGHYSPNTDFFPDLLERDINPGMFESRLETIYNYFKTMSDSYPTRELMFLFGDDFTFRNANQNFNNIEAMMNAFKNHNDYANKINFFYSTPSKYFSKVSQIIESEKTVLKTYDGLDFFPYSEFKMDYWTGYFTSRPYLKGLVRDAGHFLSAASRLLFDKRLSSQGNSVDVNKAIKGLDVLRREMGVAQHHDAVSGTAREAVSEDYIKGLELGIKASQNVIHQLMKDDDRNLLKGEIEIICLPSNSYQECREKVLNKSDLDKGIALVYLNSGSVHKTKINLKLKTDSGVVISDLFTQQEIESDLICDADLGYCELHSAIDFPDNNLYRAVKINTNSERSALSRNKFSDSPLKIADNEQSLLLFDFEKTSFYQKVKSTGEDYVVSMGHGFYEYHFWKDPMGKNRQGAYLMASDTETPSLFTLNKEKSSFFSGKGVIQIELHYEKSKLKLSIFPDFDFTVHCESVLFPSHPEAGLEFLLIVNSNVNNLNKNGKTEFYTDTNGMRTIKRIADTRQTFDFQVDDKVASNFYPVNSNLTLKEGSRELTVWNDRPQAATSLNKGQVFFVVNRWSKKDDRKGLADGIDETNSSNINFPIFHLVSLSKSCDKGAVYDFINKKPLYAVYNDVNFSSTKIINPIEQKSEISKLFLKVVEKGKTPTKFFDTPDKDCIEHNIYFISGDKVLVQFMNKLDPVIYPTKTCTVFINNLLVKSIDKMHLNGLDKFTNSILTKSFLSIKRIDVTQVIIDPLKFETFLVSF